MFLLVSKEQILYKEAVLLFLGIDYLQEIANQWHDFRINFYYRMANGIQNF